MKILINPWMWIGCLLAPSYLFTIWSLNLPTNYDSYFYTSTAKYMLDYGQFLTPVGKDGMPLFFKPPATYWQAMIGMIIFGKSIWASRISLVVTHLLSLGVFVLILKKLRVQLFPLMTCLALFGFSFASFKLTRNLVMENLLELWVLLTLWLLFHAAVRRQGRWIAVSAVVGGAACLIKGFIVPPMYGMILAAFLWTYRRKFQWTWAQTIAWGMGAVVTCIVVGLAWPLLMYIKHGDEFWNFYFVGEHLSKLGAGGTHPAGLVFAGLILYSLPFIHFVLAAVGEAALHFKQTSKESQFVFLCLGALTVLFLIPSRRDMNYMLPMICLGFLLVGVNWDRVVQGIKKLRFLPFINGALTTHVGILSILSCVIWWFIFPAIILPEFPAQARPKNSHLSVCVVGQYSGYDHYLIQAPFLPNRADAVFHPEEISNCIQERRALVFKEPRPDITQSFSDQKYVLHTRWRRIPPGLPAQKFIEAFRKADFSKVIQTHVTYIPAESILK